MLEGIEKISFTDWVKKERARRLAYIPDDKTNALRYTCEAILKTDCPSWSGAHNLLLRECNARMKPGEKRDLFVHLLDEGAQREIRQYRSDPFFHSLQKTFEGIMKWARPYYLIQNNGNLQAIKDGKYTFWEETGTWVQRFDEWSEGAMLKVDFTTKEYVAARYPIMHANETNEIPAYDGMAAEQWVFDYQDEKRFRDEIERSWKPWEYQGYPFKSDGFSSQQ